MHDTSPITHKLRAALELHQQGRLDEAEQQYRSILRIDSAHADALHLLGVATHQRGRHDEAAELIDRAIAAGSSNPAFHCNLGTVEQARGRTAEAVAQFLHALALGDRSAEVHFNLGNAYRERGELDEAVSAYREAIRVRADYVRAYVNLAATLQALERVPEAADHLRRAVQLVPGNIELVLLLGKAVEGAGGGSEAMDCYHRAIDLDPRNTTAHLSLGNVRLARREPDPALVCYEQVLAIDPECVPAIHNIGHMRRMQGQIGTAIEFLERALAIDPNYATAWNSLGIALQTTGRIGEATGCFRRALDVDPQFRDAHSNLLLALNYDSDADPSDVFSEHIRWADRFASGPAAPAFSNDRAESRPLRVGYVSADMRRHSVAYFLEPILASHDRGAVETVCYADVAVPDDMTGRLRSLAHGWRSVAGRTDRQVAELIHADRIDILVDLAGHTGGNRLPVFALKPAPVQITYLGYVNTTGLTTVDYRLTDAWADPPDVDPGLYVEELVRLPSGFLCYAPPSDAPPVTPLPAITNGHLTFGSFNNPAKITADVVALWAELLRAIPGSRLLLKTGFLRDETVGDRFRTLFESHGISAGRVEFLGRIESLAEHLALYSRVDVAVDPFPFNGTTTTCEAAWMGVPTITLSGRTHAGRVGVSLLTRLGLTQFIAASPEEYVAVAQRVSTEWVSLEQLRASLRFTMSASSLCDGSRFTRELEDIYRKLWRRWCRRTEEK